MSTDPKKAPKNVSKEEVQRRLQIEKDHKLRHQRKITSGAGAGKRKIANSDRGVPQYVKVEKSVNAITPPGRKQPKPEATPLSKLGRREIDSEGTFRKNDTEPIMKYVGGK